MYTKAHGMGIFLLTSPPSSRQRRASDERLSDLFDRCGGDFLPRRIPNGEGYEVKGDCNICVNRKLPSDSATCVECGLSRKNYKPLTNADRIRAMTDEELADMFTDIGVRTLRLHRLPVTEPVIEQAKEDWRDWLKEEASE